MSAIATFLFQPHQLLPIQHAPYSLPRHRAIVVSAIEWIKDVAPWEYKYSGGVCFDLSHVQFTLCILGLIVVIFFIWWHFQLAYYTLYGFLFFSGYEEGAMGTRANLYRTYKGSRLVLIFWAVLFTFFLFMEGKGFNYQGALLAWMLSLIAVFPVPVSMLWLGLTTGIFIQGIGSYRLRVLGCGP